ncbi:hypothetical protein ABEF92_000637 [Exophiala dermatitidis]|uniref:Short-chain dehydrogenase n=1 Tax=Exophiala dermatitidis (strain ATCC 34100 / CBS 525.76 / NIH/UT8656) TaxID=858893 RepID=H6BLN3_EXODN|nr:short-chain dehydrogenase [Exophiala dermatitidis NIH/UT8656]EHY52872.1 short-chain dehydrogenase [Exophiala dermatitidis NIH/UT8656]
MEFGFETTGAEIVNHFKESVVGKTFLITGPSPGGIGAETASSLAAASPKHLILAGRSQEKIYPLMDQIHRDHPHVKITFVQLSLGDKNSVRQAVEEVKTVLSGDGDKIDVLILNAAIMAAPYALLENGLESQFATNHLGHFLFTNLLLKADLIGSRIVVVSSSVTHRRLDSLMHHLKDLSYHQGKTYDPMTAYTVSKACNLLYAKRLAKMLKKKKISVFSLNPGSIRTNLQGYLTEEVIANTIEAMKADNPNWTVPVHKTLQQGCATQLRAALDPSLVSESGAYLDDCQVVTLPEHKDAEAYIDEVWAFSEKLVGEEFSF